MFSDVFSSVFKDSDMLKPHKKLMFSFYFQKYATICRLKTLCVIRKENKVYFKKCDGETFGTVFPKLNGQY